MGVLLFIYTFCLHQVFDHFENFLVFSERIDPPVIDRFLILQKEDTLQDCCDPFFRTKVFEQTAQSLRFLLPLALVRNQILQHPDVGT